MKMRARLKWLLILLFTLFISVSVLCMALIRFNLDSFIQPPSHFTLPAQPIFYSHTFNSSDTLAVRHYGDKKQSCLVFFPGRTGGIAHYEQTLFPYFTESNRQVFALSYPAQDGNSGRLKLASLLEQIEYALHHINQYCVMSDSIFVGRSLGATLAVFAADNWRPKGLLLEGVSVDLVTPIKATLANSAFLKGIAYLPIRHTLKNNFEINAPLVRYLQGGGKVTMFQGELDDITPFHSLKRNLIPHPNLSLHLVENATHSNTYLLAKPHYLAQLNKLTN